MVANCSQLKNNNGEIMQVATLKKMIRKVESMTAKRNIFIFLNKDKAGNEIYERGNQTLTDIENLKSNPNIKLTVFQWLD